MVAARAGKRDIPADGLKAAQSITASVIGFERDVRCVWGDDGERSEADRALGEDDGREHDHWMCDDDDVVLRSPHGCRLGTTGRTLSTVIGPGTEILVILGLLVAGGIGIFRTRERY